jgi:lysophospholipase L1-like esterase
VPRGPTPASASASRGALTPLGFFDKISWPRFTPGVRQGLSLGAFVITALVASCAIRERALEPDGSGSALSAGTTPGGDAAQRAGLPAYCAAQPNQSAKIASTGEASFEPVLSPEILKFRAQAQQRILKSTDLIEDESGQIVRDGGSSSKREVVAPRHGNALGHFVPIENEANLAYFHAALERLQTSCQSEDKVRIAVYGASHTQADIYTSYLRRYLQSRFGNGGQGFVPLALAKGQNRKLDFKVENDGFRAEFAMNAPQPGRFGLLGAASVNAVPGATFRILPRRARDSESWASSYELFYGAEPQGGELSLGVDGGTPVILPSNSEPAEARYHAFELPLGAHEIALRALGNGPTRVFGFSAERSEPGVVIDTLGIGGMRASSILTWDQSLWAEHLLRRSPSLVILAYGTNEASDQRDTIPEYAQQLKQVLTRLRQIVPQASCVLVGPGDYPRADGSSWKVRPRLIEVIRTQRELAPQFGCGFWDTYSFMGGEGSMHEWASAKPALAAKDHIHLTNRGYVRMGMAFGDALMRAYDACQRGQGGAPCARVVERVSTAAAPASGADPSSSEP